MYKPATDHGHIGFEIDPVLIKSFVHDPGIAETHQIAGELASIWFFQMSE